MKFLFVLLSLVLSSQAFSREDVSWNEMTGKWAIGVALGSPTGVSALYYLNEMSSIDMMVGYNFNGNFNFHADFIHNLTDAYKIDRLDMNISYGAGLRVRNISDEEFLFGPRGMIATSHFLEHVPLEIGLELAGIFSLVERTDFDLEAFLNVRYYF